MRIQIASTTFRRSRMRSGSRKSSMPSFTFYFYLWLILFLLPSLWGHCDNDCLSVNQSLCGISHAFHFYEMWCRLFKRVFVVQYRLAIDLSCGQIYDLPRAWFLIIDYETIEDFRRVLCGSRTWDRVWGSSKSRRRNCLSVSLPKDCTFIYTV